jgi:hypothetical protein
MRCFELSMVRLLLLGSPLIGGLSGGWFMTGSAPTASLGSRGARQGFV